jgi:carboxyl-terminal processing protease
MKASVRVALLSFVFALCLVGSFAAGVVADRLWLAPLAPAAANAISSLTSDVTARQAGELDTFNTVWNMINESFYFQPVDKGKITRAATKALVAALEEEHSRYLTPEENAPTRSQMQGHFDGIGVWLDTEGGVLRIIAPMDNSPAQRAGVQANDIIIAIDGRDVTGLKTDEATQLVRGKAGSKVRLTLRRAGAEQPIELEVERGRIEVDAVTSRVLEGNVGYVRVTVFGDKTTSQLDAALKDLTARPVKAIVLDLRNNGGGWVSASREMLGRFLPDGTALVERGRNGERIDTVLPSNEVRAYEVPLVVLVNGGTASASEIVAGALQDRKRATVIGEVTYGKGSIQTVREFGDGSSARLTTAVWLTPDKKVIEKHGIVPDISVGPDGEHVDDTLRGLLAQSRPARAVGPGNPDGKLGPPDWQLARALRFIATGQ